MFGDGLGSARLAERIFGYIFEWVFVERLSYFVFVQFSDHQVVDRHLLLQLDLSA